MPSQTWVVCVCTVFFQPKQFGCSTTDPRAFLHVRSDHFNLVDHYSLSSHILSISSGLEAIGPCGSTNLPKSFYGESELAVLGQVPDKLRAEHDGFKNGDFGNAACRTCSKGPTWAEFVPPLQYDGGQMWWEALEVGVWQAHGQGRVSQLNQNGSKLSWHF